MFRHKLANVPLPSDPTVRRSHLSPNELVTRPAGNEVVIVGDIFEYAVSADWHGRGCSEDTSASAELPGEETWKQDSGVDAGYIGCGRGGEGGAKRGRDGGDQVVEVVSSI
jgi:hypothetical protein